MRKIITVLVAALITSTLSLASLAVSAVPAEAAGCFRSVTVGGQNAYGYGKSYSWQSYARFVRTAPVATLCINYAQAYGGYYISYVTCTQSSARLTTDTTSRVRSSDSVAAAYWTYASCRSTATWKWDRTVANDECASLWAQSRWNLNQTTGTVTHYTTNAQHDNFVPGYC